MADFKTPNLCGANPNLNESLSKIEELKDKLKRYCNNNNK